MHLCRYYILYARLISSGTSSEKGRYKFLLAISGADHNIEGFHSWFEKRMKAGQFLRFLTKPVQFGFFGSSVFIQIKYEFLKFCKKCYKNCKKT